MYPNQGGYGQSFAQPYGQQPPQPPPFMQQPPMMQYSEAPFMGQPAFNQPPPVYGGNMGPYYGANPIIG